MIQLASFIYKLKVQLSALFLKLNQFNPIFFMCFINSERNMRKFSF